VSSEIFSSVVHDEKLKEIKATNSSAFEAAIRLKFLFFIVNSFSVIIEIIVFQK
jgi:orotidine-5'-phosphate decarboxylase